MADAHNQLDAVPTTPAAASTERANFDSYIIPTPSATTTTDRPASTPPLQPISEQTIEVKPLNTPGWINDNAQQSAESVTEEVDGRPELHETREAILDVFDNAVGEQPWKDSPHAAAVGDGEKAGAANISELLTGAEIADVSAAKVRGEGGLQDQLEKQGWMQRGLEHAKPGDILITPMPGGGSKVGVIGEDGSFYTHDKQGRITKIQNYRMPSPATGAYVVSPPETCNE